MTQARPLDDSSRNSSAFSERSHAARNPLRINADSGKLRKLGISALRPDGSVQHSEVKVPAIPEFDATFAAFTSGTLLQGETTRIAIEDLQPGQYLQTVTGDLAQVMWIGSSIVIPNDATAPMPLIRVMADSFGVGRPDAFVTTGPAARVLQTPQDLRANQDGAQILASLAAFEDGVNVIRLMPPTPVALFHLCLDKHAVINAGGLQAESYYPDIPALQKLPTAMLALHNALFPHIRRLNDFGALTCARAPAHSTDQTAA